MLKKIVGLVVLAFVAIGVLALMFGEDEPGSATQQNDVANTEAEGSAKADSTDKGPMRVKNWEVQGKLQPEAEEFTNDFTARFRVKNVADHDSTPFLTLNAMKGDEIIGSLDCHGPETGPGQISTVKCMSTDDFRDDWDRLTLEGTF